MGPILTHLNFGTLFHPLSLQKSTIFQLLNPSLIAISFPIFNILPPFLIKLTLGTVNPSLVASTRMNENKRKSVLQWKHQELPNMLWWLIFIGFFVRYLIVSFHTCTYISWFLEWTCTWHRLNTDDWPFFKLNKKRSIFPTRRVHQQLLSSNFLYKLPDNRCIHGNTDANGHFIVYFVW